MANGLDSLATSCSCIQHSFLIRLVLQSSSVAVHNSSMNEKSLYILAARKIRKKIRSWSRSGNPNVSDFVLILGAEQAVLDKMNELAEDSCSKAIPFVARADTCTILACSTSALLISSSMLEMIRIGQNTAQRRQFGFTTNGELWGKQTCFDEENNNRRSRC